MAAFLLENYMAESDNDLHSLVIYLKNNQQLTYQEIGDRLGITSSSAKGIYRRHKDKYTTEHKPDSGIYVVGETLDQEKIDYEELWSRAISRNNRYTSNQQKRKNNKIVLIPPCGLALLSDAHFGSERTDYQSLKDDAELIRDTESMYCGFHGDGVDNWIVGKLQALQRGQILTLDEEWNLFSNWLEMLEGKMAYVVAGNHDNWTFKVSGFDKLKEIVSGLKVLYDRDEITFDLNVGSKTYPVKVRHKWKGSSVFNVTHSIEVGWERGGNDFVIGIGGHTHQGTYCRPFSRHQVRRYAVLTGTYKLDDDYGKELGLDRPQNKGCGAFVFDKDGVITFYENLKQAAEVLAFYKEKE